MFQTSSSTIVSVTLKFLQDKSYVYIYKDSFVNHFSGEIDLLNKDYYYYYYYYYYIYIYIYDSTQV